MQTATKRYWRQTDDHYDSSGDVFEAIDEDAALEQMADCFSQWADDSIQDYNLGHEDYEDGEDRDSMKRNRIAELRAGYLDGLEEVYWEPQTQIVTLRDVEAAGIPLDSNFGCDESEHTELLDDTTILRLTREGPDTDVRLECYSGRIGSDAAWSDCVHWQYSASGASDRNQRAIVQSWLNLMWKKMAK